MLSSARAHVLTRPRRAGLRPFGVSFLFAGWDRHHGFQLYHSDPSGNYAGWKATAIGNNNQVRGPHSGGGGLPSPGALVWRRGIVASSWRAHHALTILLPLPATLPQAAKSFLKGEYKDDLKVEGALELVVKVRAGGSAHSAVLTKTDTSSSAARPWPRPWT